MRNKHSLDFLVIASLEEEFVAVRSAFSSNYSIHILEDNPIGRIYGAEISLSKGEVIQGLIASPNKVGRVNAAIFTTYILSSYEFKYIALTGLAGGIKYDSRYERERKSRDAGFPYIGDIVFADSIIDIDMGKLYDSEYYMMVDGEGFIPRPRVKKIGDDTLDSFISFKSMKHRYVSGGGGRHAQSFPSSNIPESFVGPILSTEAVIASESDAKRLAERAVGYAPHRYPIAIEMEGYGVAEAVETIGRHSRFFVVKAINDYANHAKNIDEIGGRRLACANAATITRNFLEYLYFMG